MYRPLCVLLLLAFATLGAQAKLQIDAKIIGMRGSSPYNYLRVHITNPSGHKVGYRFLIRSHFMRELRIPDQEIEPASHKIHHIPVPIGYQWYQVQAWDSDKEHYLHHQQNNYKRVYLNICKIDTWASEKEMQDFSELAIHGEHQPRGTSSTGGLYGGMPSSGLYGGLPPTTRHRGGGRSAAPAKPNYVSQVEPGTAPDNWLCYIPFQAVFIDGISYKNLTPTAKDALHTWVDAGGILAVYNTDQKKTQHSILGNIHHFEGNPIKEQIFHRDWLDMPPRWQQLYGGSLSNREPFPYMVLEMGGRMETLFLATLFLIVAGPINYFYHYKKKKIRRLMLSLPAISIAFCLLITAYFIGTQGFARKGGSLSLTLLDEATDAGLTLSHHVLFSGLYPLSGFHFDRQTAFYPLIRPDQTNQFALSLNQKQQLHSGLFIPSKNFHYYTNTPFKTRERLLYDSAENVVGNGFEHSFQKLAIYHAKSIYEASDIVAGGKAQLKQKEYTELSQVKTDTSKPIYLLNCFYDSLSVQEFEYFKRYLLPYIDIMYEHYPDEVFYLALLEEAPASTQPGLETNPENQRHLFFGRLEGAAPTATARLME
ncbi:hypothetical protein GF373_03965 [bacterium]|nr:hypothetical protein [bacterium]